MNWHLLTTEILIVGNCIWVMFMFMYFVEVITKHASVWIALVFDHYFDAKKRYLIALSKEELPEGLKSKFN